MNDHVIRYKGYIIDFTPFEAGNLCFGPRWAIARDDAVWAGSVPLSSGLLMFRGTFEQAAEIGKHQAMRMIDCE
ncbi:MULTISPECIES: hypothetical protein [Paraburkholderia]|uniref:hypothetical protein n=1 Tax=Paraburkholderia TaxID=1822464 RepID=UPI00197DE7E1|nr:MULTISPECIES: hypothetical protein [Paraburkholderia]MBN3812809.1 hypothetical protein [Paraburkholderia sp. Ac-20347]